MSQYLSTLRYDLQLHNVSELKLVMVKRELDMSNSQIIKSLNALISMVSEQVYEVYGDWLVIKVRWKTVSFLNESKYSDELLF